MEQGEGEEVCVCVSVCVCLVKKERDASPHWSVCQENESPFSSEDFLTPCYCPFTNCQRCESSPCLPDRDFVPV